MFVKKCGGDACGSRVFHPHGPGVVVVKKGSADKSFAAMFGKCASMLCLFVDVGFHADGEEESAIVVVWVVHVGVGGNFGVYFRLT